MLIRHFSGIWQKARNLGREINSEKLDYCPFVSPDGRFLFFTSQRIDPRITEKVHKDLGEIRQLEDSPQNGLGDIYWVDFDAADWQF